MSRVQWTFETIQREALKYESRSGFFDNANPAYTAARRRGILDKVCSHMISPSVIYSLDDIKREALKYSKKADFEKKSPGAYQASRRRGVYHSVCAHMKPTHKQWSYDDIAKEADKYSCRKDFKKYSGTAYANAQRRGVMDKICAHMKPTRKRWSINELFMEASKHKSRTSFAKRASGAYCTAHRRGVLDKICAHMPVALSGFDPSMPGTLYYLSINNGEAYKIGITNLPLNERFYPYEMNIITILKKWSYQIGADAYAEEQRILKEFAYAKWTGDDLLRNGNTELFDRDILNLDKGIR